MATMANPTKTGYEKPKCPQCGRLQIQYLKRTNSYWCRLCGHQWQQAMWVDSHGQEHWDTIKKGG